MYYVPCGGFCYAPAFTCVNSVCACACSCFDFRLTISILCSTPAASSSASCKQCRYLFVVSMSPCPSRPCTCFRLTPPYKSSVAEVCRSAWNFRCRNPLRSRNFENCRVGVQGFIISPFHWVNSQPPSCHWEPSRSRSRSFSCSSSLTRSMQ